VQVLADARQGRKVHVDAERSEQAEAADYQQELGRTLS